MSLADVAAGRPPGTTAARCRDLALGALATLLSLAGILAVSSGYTGGHLLLAMLVYALIAGFVLHHGLVTRSRLAAWLLTGKRASRAQAVSSAAIPSTVGRCSASSVQLSPPSKLPNTDPVLVPK